MADRRLPYGSWPSPISAEDLTRSHNPPAGLVTDGADVWWAESRPADGGRIQLLRRTPDGTVTEVLPDGAGARSRVNEYGGGAWTVDRGVVYYANWGDQRVYRLEPGGTPRPLTPEPRTQHGLRYADLAVDPTGSFLVAVRERHEGDEYVEHGEPVDDLVAIRTDGGGVVRLAGGHDFYSAPRVSPDGDTLAWVAWDHPNMPWDTTRLYLATLRHDGEQVTAADPIRVMDRDNVAVVQPEWGPDGALWFTADPTGWSNLFRAEPGGSVTQVTDLAAEIGVAAGYLGARGYAVLPDGRVAASLTENGVARLVLVDPSGEITELDRSGTSYTQPRPLGGSSVAVIRAAPSELPVVVEVPLDGAQPRPVSPDPARPVAAESVSVPEVVDFESAGGRTAYAFFYPPTGEGLTGEDGELPPVIVFSHGGPTSHVEPVFKLATQYWTSRGIAVCDVNYTGSTGYGRAYRDALRGQWGIADVEDCAAAVGHLAATGRVDGSRAAVAGGSAGGYTTLVSLTTTRVFSAGISLFGVADLELLAKDTHKFESRYLDSLIGPYPEAIELYRERSPVHHADRLSCPVMIAQGLDDKVVPPRQAEVMVEALRRLGLPFVYLAIEGEGHGFRSAANIVRSTESQLWFLGRVFGFAPADSIPTPPAEGFTDVPAMSGNAGLGSP